jgi:small-conductance mechanosensitive channel
LNEHPLVEAEGARASLAEFGSSSLKVDVFANIKTTDYTEYCLIREELLMRIRAIVEAQGSALALPAQISYTAQDTLSTPPRRPAI